MADKIPACSVIIPVFNKWDLTRNCLLSLCEHSLGHDVEIIVVDNGSTDETAAALVPLGTCLFRPRFRVIRFSENRNFAPACNAGAKEATSPLLFFLNNDTILTPGWLPPLLEAMRGSNPPGAVGPLLLYTNDTVQHMGVAFNITTVTHLYSGFPADHPLVFHKRPFLNALTGAALMMSRSLFLDYGGFFEGYKNGFEDIDICLRLRERGEKLACIPASRVYHLESRTEGRHDNTKDNSTLFNARCGKLLPLDLHRHAFADGFRVVVNDLMELSLALEEKEEARLSAFAAGQPEEAYNTLIKQNPLWIQGHEFLAQKLLREGRYAEAMYHLSCLAVIEEKEARYRALIRVAPQAVKSGYANNIEKYAIILEKMHSFKKLDAKIILRQLRQRIDPKEIFLIDLYRNALRERTKIA
ncbi:glycosyl transferase family 2 [Deltaproteobacteria bacterium]|nr:glycosyl transferase family 2 [Deltaproteobacteria bacterium]